MDSLELKNRIKEYVDQADERMLRVIYETIENDEAEIPDTHKKVLEERLKYHEENPDKGISWEEVRESLKKKYGF